MPTLTELQTRLAEYRATESRILRAQKFTVGQGQNARSLERVPLDVVQAQIKELEAQIEKLEAAGARRGYRLVPGGR